MLKEGDVKYEDSPLVQLLELKSHFIKLQICMRMSAGRSNCVGLSFRWFPP